MKLKVLYVLVIGDPDLQHCQPRALGGLPRSNCGSVLVPIAAGRDLLTGGSGIQCRHSFELGIAYNQFRNVMSMRHAVAVPTTHRMSVVWQVSASMNRSCETT